ncbi:cAMP-binding domain of CRP or a regulatory subunit of cAMP-dependent protein kinases [Actinopolyspora alba]|uniref:cAMP-binding domain of CRP or a regulatory subunit of cAMP-dependent protein kinases n=1 Tax=Actinopolyspora alba TaxID=673379 RepID=A0A1I1VPD8_9ACTN|nr:Crp/Fnr family transcriptional regulator [Actinopolyspora alba]SFD84684.1 cAMP-binding domain of CRP or a regulatory subunit of cAMP-dependent protein kinases [Actinopolyspora alba]
MTFSRLSSAALDRAVRALGPGDEAQLAVRQAAWVARCVGRGEAAPLRPDDLTALATFLRTRHVSRHAPLFHGGSAPAGVWIVREGRVELSVSSGRRRSVVHVLRPGDVDGDIQHLLEMILPYTARALEDATVLFLSAADFERLLGQHPAILRRWLSSVAQRPATSQQRVIGLLGRSLPQQVAQLLLDEAAEDRVPLPQRTLAAMVGAQRPSLNKILKEFEARKLITVRYAAIELHDIAGLHRVLEQEPGQ